MTLSNKLRASALLLALALGAGAALATPQAGARAAMQGTIDEVLAILRAPGNEDQKTRRTKIEVVAKQRFDFGTMSKLVLKRDWKRFSAAEQKEFVVEFTNYLAASYGTRIARYGREDVVTLGERAEVNGDVSVQTVIKGGDFDGAAVDYRMRTIAGEWRVIDVVIEGVSLVANFRSQFADVIAKGGPQELLKRLKEKNAAGIVDAPPTEKKAG